MKSRFAEKAISSGSSKEAGTQTILEAKQTTATRMIASEFLSEMFIAVNNTKISFYWRSEGDPLRRLLVRARKGAVLI